MSPFAHAAVSPNVGVVMFTLAMGLLALAPLRSRLDAWGYHLGAMPVGLVLWGPVALASASLRQPWDWPLVAASLAGSVALAAAFSFAVARADSGGARTRTPAPWRGIAAHLAAVWALTTLLAALGWSTYSTDSYAGYSRGGLWLFDTGLIGLDTLTMRSILLPAADAGMRLLGGEWLYALYPVLAAYLLAIVGRGLALGAWREARPAARAAGIGITLALLASTAPFLMHAFYVHSNLASALYLTLGLLAIGCAWERPEGRPSAVWLALAGLCALGMGWVRPDGAAYAAVVLQGVLAVRYLRGEPAWRAIAAYVAPQAFGLAALAAFQVMRFGGGGSPRRLSGVEAVVMTAAVVLSGVAVAAAGGWAPVRRALAGARVWVALAALNALALAGTWVVEPAGLTTALDVARVNLVGGKGGWNRLWMAAPLAGAGALALGRDADEDGWRSRTLFAVLQFLALALVVHALRHPGRVGWGDSFNRVAFHIAPAVFWLGALAASDAWSALRGARRAGS